MCVVTHVTFQNYPSQPNQFHMLSPKRICWLKVKITLITHAHVVNIVAWYNLINPIHCHRARSATRRQKYNIGWKKVYFFAVFLCLPASPRPITMVLASHSTSTFRLIVFLNVTMSRSGSIDRSTEHGGASAARLKFQQILCVRFIATVLIRWV